MVTWCKGDDNCDGEDDDVDGIGDVTMMVMPIPISTMPCNQYYQKQSNSDTNNNSSTTPTATTTIATTTPSTTKIPPPPATPSTAATTKRVPIASRAPRLVAKAGKG